MSEYANITGSTRMIDPTTGEYKLTLTDIKQRHSNVIWGTPVTEDVILFFGYAVVHPTAPPVGDVVTEVAPVLESGQYNQKWDVRPFDTEELATQLENAKDAAISKVSSLSAQALERGVPHKMPDGAEQHVQLRDGDRANHAGIAAKILRDPTASLPFRTLENNIFMLESDELTAITNAAYDGYVQVLGGVWALTDNIRKATTIGAVPAIPGTLKDFYTNVLNWEWYDTTSN